MKSLKYIIASLVLALGFAAPVANAQDAAPKNKQGGQRGGGAFAPEARVQRMTDQLKLTTDQQQKILAIYQADAKKMESIPADQRRAKMQEINQVSEPKILAILTPEQQTKYKEMMQNRQRGGPAKSGGKAPKAE